MHDKTSLDLLSNASVDSLKEFWIKVDSSVLLDLVVDLWNVATDVGHQLWNKYQLAISYLEILLQLIRIETETSTYFEAS